MFNERRVSWMQHLLTSEQWKLCFARLREESKGAMLPSQVEKIIFLDADALPELPFEEGEALLRLQDGRYAFVWYVLRRVAGRMTMDDCGCITASCLADLVTIEADAELENPLVSVSPAVYADHGPVPPRALRFK